MGKKKLYTAFIAAFLLLYLIVACISFVHSISFFSIGNAGWMSCLLGFSFELGQAVVLASILLSDNRKSLLTWALFIVLTAVQCIGNVYSVYAYMSRSAEEYYRYLQEPLLFWLQGVDQQTVKVIISWITGALLPVIALGMTGMVASNIRLVRGAGEPPAGTDDETVLNDTSGPVPEPERACPDEHRKPETPSVGADVQNAPDIPADTDDIEPVPSADGPAVDDAEFPVEETNDIPVPADDAVRIDMLEPVIPDDGSSSGRTELRFMPRNLKRRR